MAVPAVTASYWAGLSSAYWAVGPPLRPSLEDIQFVEKTVAAWAAQRPGERIPALQLGVTPGLASMRWPEHSSLFAVDQTLAMGKALWRGNIPGKKQFVCGDWCALPARARSFKVVVGDGVTNCMRYPEACRRLIESVFEILGDDGVFITRCFVRPTDAERPAGVMEDVRRRAIPTFHDFKFRLLMAMQPSTEEGVAVGDVYRFWRRHAPAEEWLLERPGWDKAAVDTIELYRDTETVHTFPTLDEINALLRPLFDVITVHTPNYYLGERCLTFVLRRRSAG